MNALPKFFAHHLEIEDKTECECGRPKNINSVSCRRCRFLDGDGPRQAAIISALRDSNGLSIAELCTALGRDSNDPSNGRRGVTMACVSLMKQGRLRRHWRESESAELVVSRFGMSVKKLTVSSGGAGHWVYVLDVRQGAPR